MNILGSRKIFKNWPWLQLIVLLIATIHGYFFIGGYRLTADDVSYHLIAMNGIKSSMIFIQDIAISQGRIVQFPDIATSLIGSFYADYIFFRAFYVILYLLNFFLFS